MNVNILGTQYEIIDESEEKDQKLKQCDGYVDFYVKKIVIRKFQEDPMSVGDLEKYRRKVIRHEILHAFLYESGLSTCASNPNEGWCENEEMVDWFAIQSPKILIAYKKAECL